MSGGPAGPASSIATVLPPAALWVEGDGRSAVEHASGLGVDGERLWKSLMAMAEIGATPAGGCNRLALSDLDRVGRDLFCAWCRAAGLALRIDRMGNLFARRTGRDSTRPPILVGSHLDTQPTGGKFDGVYGVLAGLEVVRTLNDAAVETEGPLDVVVWTNEEGARFAPAMIGSGVWAGVFDIEEAHDARDADGLRFGDELARIGYLGDTAAQPFTVHGAFEAHIEQGPVLEAETLQVGVVTGVQGMRWYDLRVAGVACHAGTTPMAPRRDPARTAAETIAGFYHELERFGPDARATIGVLRSSPESRNTVPAEVSASVDLRHPDPATLDAMETALRQGVDAACRARGTTGALERVWDSPPIVFDVGCVDAVRGAAAARGYTHRDLVSGAGHDSVYVSRVAPTAMIFVPCLDGLSHNEAESATPADLTAGANVLLGAVLARDATPPG